MVSRGVLETGRGKGYPVVRPKSRLSVFPLFGLAFVAVYLGSMTLENFKIEKGYYWDFLYNVNGLLFMRMTRIAPLRSMTS